MMIKMQLKKDSVIYLLCSYFTLDMPLKPIVLILLYCSFQSTSMFNALYIDSFCSTIGKDFAACYSKNATPLLSYFI